jgi:hypothetical protein
MLAQDEAIGALMYKLQRKNIEQSNVKVTSNEEAMCLQLVVIWKARSPKEFWVTSFLIEHDKGHIWDKDRLIRLSEHYSLCGIQRRSIEWTWLLHDNTVLMTSVNGTHEEECYKLEMTISEEVINKDTQRPQYIDIDA